MGNILNAYGIYVEKTVRFAMIKLKKIRIKLKLRFFNCGKLITKALKWRCALVKLQKFSNINK